MMNDPQTGPGGFGGSRTATALAGLALFVALLAAGVSLVALSRSGDDQPPAVALTTAASTPPDAGAPQTTDAQTTDAQPTDSLPTDALPTDATATTDPGEESPSEPTDGPDPAGVYTVAYDDEPLRLQPSSRYIDLDEPSGNAQSNASELQYFSASAPKFDFGNVALATVGSAAPTANDCALQLRRAPIDRSFAPEKGQQICVLTNRQAADDLGIRQKIVLLRVASIGADGTLNLTLSAWTVPR